MTPRASARSQESDPETLKQSGVSEDKRAEPDFLS
jgi:hypothetical protein